MFKKTLCYPNKKSLPGDLAASGLYLFNNNKILMFTCGLFFKNKCL